MDTQSDIQSDTQSGKLRILIADDHPLLRMGLANMISQDPRFALAGEAQDGSEAIDLYKSMRPDVVLMDLQMPRINGVQAIEAIRKFDAQALIVILTTFDGEEDIYSGLRAGAKAYLLKDASSQQVINCILTVVQGRKYLPPEVASKLAQRMDASELSEREMEILTLMASGKSNKQVARLTSITEGTVKFHVNNILSKLGVASRTEAVAVAAKRGIARFER
jgi:DNA-binding NarL/FixJ family response regulator